MQALPGGADCPAAETAGPGINRIPRADATLSVTGELRGAIAGIATLEPRRLRSLVLQGGSSVLQQGLFAGASFLTNVLLARWLTASSYGAFALANSAMLLVLMCYSAVFFEPIIVFGAGRYAEDFPSYIRAVLRAHFASLCPLGLLLAFVTLMVGRYHLSELHKALLMLGGSLSFLLLIWLCRGAFYAQTNPHAGTKAGAVYFAILLISIGALRSLNALSAATAWSALALSSLLVSLGCLYRFRRRAASDTRPLTAAGVMRVHWGYGRWATMAALAAWIPANLFYLVLPARFGLASTAMLRALMNLLYPLLNSLSALVLLLIPMLVRQLGRNGVAGTRRIILQLTGLFLPCAVVYFLVVATFGARIMHVLYAGRYSDISSAAVIAAGLLPITTGIAGLLGAALRALERPQMVFWAGLASTCVAVSIGVPLTLRHGVSGAAIALVLNDLPAIVVLALFLARCRDREGAAA